jgi:cell division septum initiation protein DivIVA
MIDWLKAHASPWWALALLLCWPVLELGVLLHRTRPAVEASVWQASWLFDCTRNRACLSSQTAGMIGAARAASVQSYEASKAARATAQEVAGTVREVRPHVVATVRNTEQATAELAAAMHQLSGIAGELRDQLSPILASTNADLQQLDANLESIQRLTDGLDAQIRAGGPVASEDLQKLGVAIDSINTLVADPHLAKTLANTERATNGMAGAAESIDFALRPWRARAGLLKTILSRAFGIVKLTYPIK